MRRLVGHLFTLCSAVSLLLFVAVCVLWVRSYRIADDVFRMRTVVNADESVDGKFWGIAASRGGLSLNITHHHWPAAELKEDGIKHETGVESRHTTEKALRYRRYGPSRDTRGGERLGFEWRRHIPGMSDYIGGFAVVVPAWAVVSVTGALPASWVVLLWRWRAQRQRIRAGLCAACGYDLRASPERCPECGTLAGKVNA